MKKPKPRLEQTLQIPEGLLKQLEGKYNDVKNALLMYYCTVLLYSVLHYSVLHYCTHVKISYLVTTCYEAVNRMCSPCLFPVVDKSAQVVINFNKVDDDDDNSLATSLFQQVNIVWM